MKTTKSIDAENVSWKGKSRCVGSFVSVEVEVVVRGVILSVNGKAPAVNQHSYLSNQSIIAMAIPVAAAAAAFW